MATIEQIKRGFASYLDAEVLPHLPGGTVRRVVIGTAAAMLVNNMGKTLAEAVANPALHTIGIVTEDGGIDVDALADALRQNITDEGMRLNLDVMGFHLGDMTFKREDVDRLREHIKRY